MSALFSAVVSDDSLIDYLCTKMKESALDLQQFWNFKVLHAKKHLTRV